MDIKKIFIVLLAIAVSFGVGFKATYRPTSTDSIITVEVAPSKSKILIDGERAGTGQNKLASGDHVIDVSYEGFKSQTKTVTTQFGDKVYVGVVLVPSTAETKDWYTQSESDNKLAETISSRQTDYDSKSLTYANGLLQQLPFSYGDGHGGMVRISSGIPLSGSSQPAIYISAATPQDRQNALAWIRSNGFDPSVMDIVFENEATIYEYAGE